MALPNRLRSARMTNATLGSSIDDEVGNLEKALCDLLGIPIDTDIAAALFAVTAAGLQKLTLQNASANPVNAGELQRNNTRLLWHNTERAVELQPAGEVKFFAGTVTPAGWLACDGAAVSRATYARLFATIGTLFGVGDGSTTFNVPDLKGRVIVGQNPADVSGDFDPIGKIGGTKTVPGAAHQHNLAAHTHEQQGAFTSSFQAATVQFNTGSGTNATVGHSHSVAISGPTQAASPNLSDVATPPATSVVQPYITLAPFIST